MASRSRATAPHTTIRGSREAPGGSDRGRCTFGTAGFRCACAGSAPYNAAATAFSNLGPNNTTTEQDIAANIHAYLKLEGPYNPGLTAARVPVDADTFIVLVTRGHVHDQACLEEVLYSGAAYIGMIGSRRRVRTVIEHAEARGYDGNLLRRVHAPIGLDLAAQTPGEIAVAIMAEIVNVRRGGHASSLARGAKTHVR